ncbi:MAG: hypothetical protein KGH54_01670 [Candidatus Micrarchaeota archaeon]|nr:hypothetical protein [Candidatus Micrarchaeota archaeon]
MEVANVEMPRIKTSHRFAYFDHVLGGVGVDLDIYFQRDNVVKAIGFKATPPLTITMRNGRPQEDRRMNLSLVDGFLSVCDKNQIPVEIQISKMGISSEDINRRPKVVQVLDDDLPRDRLTVKKFENQMLRSSEFVFFGSYSDYAHKELRYRVHIQAAVVIPDIVEQIKSLERP